MYFITIIIDSEGPSRVLQFGQFTKGKQKFIIIVKQLVCLYSPADQNKTIIISERAATKINSHLHTFGTFADQNIQLREK